MLGRFDPSEFVGAGLSSHMAQPSIGPDGPSWWEIVWLSECRLVLCSMAEVRRRTNSSNRCLSRKPVLPRDTSPQAQEPADEAVQYSTDPPVSQPKNDIAEEGIGNEVSDATRQCRTFVEHELEWGYAWIDRFPPDAR